MTRLTDSQLAALLARFDGSVVRVADSDDVVAIAALVNEVRALREALDETADGWPRPNKYDKVLDATAAAAREHDERVRAEAKADELADLADEFRAMRGSAIKKWGGEYGNGLTTGYEVAMETAINRAAEIRARGAGERTDASRSK